MRTRLQIEYVRLLNWVEVVGLVEYGGKDLPEDLKTDRLVLVAILTEIRVLMDDFAELHGKYYQLRPDQQMPDQSIATDTELVEEFASISISYEKRQAPRKHPRGTNRLIAMGRDMKAIVRNPRRLQWVSGGSEDFAKLVARLTELNDYLHELIRGKKAKDLELITRKSYLEMIQIKSSVEELKMLVIAARFKIGGDSDHTRGDGVHDSELLGSLADFKRFNIEQAISPNEGPPTYEDAVSLVLDNVFNVDYEDSASTKSLGAMSSRPQGSCEDRNRHTKQVWIEWKAYNYGDWNDEMQREPPVAEDVQRVQKLVALLQRPKPKEFCIPECLGYFDEQDKSKTNGPISGDFRFGLVFTKPKDTAAISLLELFQNSHIMMPALTDRIAIASRIAHCVLYLHAVDWLHKSIRSDNILFFAKKDFVNLESPQLSGFELARPDTIDAQTVNPFTTEEQLHRWDLYRHPSYQGSGSRPKYRKTYDIYSLGIVMLELAYWKPIDKIMGIHDPEKAQIAEIEGIRQRLLSEPKHLNYLRQNVGQRCHDAVKACIKGPTAFGIEENQDELELETESTLQQGFYEYVVITLQDIRL